MGVIRLDHVEKKLGNFRLSDISFVLPEGYILGLVGANGSGKSTLIRLIMGLYGADAGEISVLGANPKTQEAQVKDQIGFVLPPEIFAGGCTLKSNADRYGKYYTGYDPGVFKNYCGRFGLSMERPLGKLSRGEKLKFQLAFALSHAPKLLLLDEPSANFDPEFREDFFRIIREFISDGEHGVVLATHLIPDLERIADYVAMLDGGKLVFCMERTKLEDSYRIVSGEAYKLRLIPKERVIAMESYEYGARAFVKHSKHAVYDPELCVSVPTLKEIMYYHAKKEGGRHL